MLLACMLEAKFLKISFTSNRLSRKQHPQLLLKPQEKRSQQIHSIPQTTAHPSNYIAPNL